MYMYILLEDRFVLKVISRVCYLSGFFPHPIDLVYDYICSDKYIWIYTKNGEDVNDT